jgi:hypothetical protein
MNKALEVCKTAKSEFEKCGIHTYLSTLHFAKNLPTDITFTVFLHISFRYRSQKTINMVKRNSRKM